jgi:predicted kinase
MNEQEAIKFHEKQMAGSEDYKIRFSKSKTTVFGNSIEGRSINSLEGKVFIATVGFSHAGKSTVAKILQERFPQLVRVETDAVHDVINANFPQLQDDNTIEGEGYWLRQAITGNLREGVIEKLVDEGWWIINDSANLQRSERSRRLDMPIKMGYKTMIIWINTPEDILLHRLRKADESSVTSGEKTVYSDLYEKVQKQRMEEPTRDEADILLAFEIVDDSAIDKIVQELDEFTI